MELIRACYLMSALATIGMWYAFVNASLAQEPLAAQPAIAPDARLDSALRVESQERPDIVDLVPGMLRTRVDTLLGPPQFESVIGATNQTKSNYDNGMTLWFQNNRLSGLTGIDYSTDSNSVKLGEQSIIIAPELFGAPFETTDPTEAEYGPNVRNAFLFAPAPVGSPPLDVRFTPAAPTCLTNDLPGYSMYGPPGICSDWILTTGVSSVLLHRSSTDFRSQYDLGGGTISSEPLSTGLVPGFEVNLNLNLNDLDFVEGRYLGLLEWSADNSSANVATPPDNLTVQQDFEARYFDVQINHIRRLQDSSWEVLWGMRYAESNDAANARFRGQFDPGTGVIPVDLSANYRAENELFGIQVGTQRSWNCESLSFYTGLKGGVFYNRIAQSGTFPTAIGSFREATDEISFMGDFEASVQYAVTQYTLLSIGYRGIGLSDIAQSSRQSDVPSAPSALWFNGAFLRAAIFW